LTISNAHHAQSYNETGMLRNN